MIELTKTKVEITLRLIETLRKLDLAEESVSHNSNMLQAFRLWDFAKKYGVVHDE